MKFFNPNIIKTDPGLSPSFRFSVILNHHFNDFKFLKSANSLVKDFEYGRQEINLSFITTMGFIHSVQCFIKIIFKDLEKKSKKLLPDYSWTNWTISVNLGYSNDYLYEERTGKYTDKSLNNAASLYIKQFKDKALEIFSNYKDYNALETALNANPERIFEHCVREDKRIINGLILANDLRPVSYYNYLKEIYLKRAKVEDDIDEEEILLLVSNIDKIPRVQSNNQKPKAEG
jgi:hypothetical protein